MDKIQAMQVFIRIVESNSLRGASDTLGLPPSTVSETLKSLESELGVQLLQRTTRRLNVTPDGEIYLEHARRVLDDIAQMEAGFAGAKAIPHGRLRVGVVRSIGRLLLIPRLHEFRARYPDIVLTLNLDDRTVDYVKEGFGCAIRTGPLEDSSSLIGRQLGAFRWMTCAAPAYIERYGKPDNPEALLQHECVAYSFGGTGKTKEWEFIRDGETYRHTPSGHLFVTDTEAYVECGLSGLGVIQAGTYLLSRHIRVGQLVPILEKYTTPPMTVSMVYANNRQLSPVVRAFYEWVREVFAESEEFGPAQLQQTADQ